HLGFLHAGPLGDAHRPALQIGAALDRLGDDDVGALVERRADRPIADLGDAAAAVGLARLIFGRRQAEMRADGFRRREPRRIVDRRARVSRRAIARSRLSKPLNSRRSVARTASSDAAITARFGWPPTSSSMRASNRAGATLPTLSPKPRKTPRRLISTSWSAFCTSLRAVSIAPG